MTDPRNPAAPDPMLPLKNLNAVRTRLDSLSEYLTNSVKSNTVLPAHHLNSISSELTSAIHNVIINAASLLATTQSRPEPNPTRLAVGEKDLEIVEVGAEEILADHVHVCHICGKGFKRDANLRMHMRAHGDQYKTPQALAKPSNNDTDTDTDTSKRRFSCPYIGCTRNKESANFQPMKTMVCVRNHFKRSHCPKKYMCHQCNHKSFSIMGDLKTHLKVCGKDKLVSLSHIPAFQVSSEVTVTEDTEVVKVTTTTEAIGSSSSGAGAALLEYDEFWDEVFMF